AQDAGVVHDDVDAAERVECRLHDRLAVLGCSDGVRVRDCLAAGGLDLVDDLLGGRRTATGAVDRAAEVVHDDERAPAREQLCVLAAETATGTGDDCNPAVEPEISHRSSPMCESAAEATIAAAWDVSTARSRSSRARHAGRVKRKRVCSRAMARRLSSP